MDDTTEDIIAARVKAAVDASQNDIIAKLDTLISSKFSSFENKIQDNSEAQFSKIQQNMLCAEPHKFARKSCEDQHKFNVKVRAKLVEAEHLSAVNTDACQLKIAEGIDLVDYRQKLIKLADTSECGWKAVEEYIANPIADNSDDERRMDKARAKGNRKVKEAKQKFSKGGGRYRPYDQRSRLLPAVSTAGPPQDSYRGAPSRGPRPGNCFACGKIGHWRLECPATMGTAVATGGNKMSIPLLSKHVEPEVLNNDLSSCVEGVSKSLEKSNGQVADKPVKAHVHVIGSESPKLEVSIDAKRISPVGRLRTCIDHWHGNGTCDSVMTIVADGYRIPFREIPPSVELSNNKSSRENPTFVKSEIAKLLQLGCISEVPVAPYVVNPLTVAYNRSGKPRLVLDCRHINLYLHKFRFKYEDARVARDLFQQGDFLFTFDLKSAYHHIEIFLEHRKFLGFHYEFDNELRYFVFNVLPFGIATAGYIFTKVLREVVKHVRGIGHRLIMYLDDGIGGHGSGGGANEASAYVLKALVDYGFIIAHEKCQWKPSQYATWLGYTWSMSVGVVRITTDRVDCLLAQLSDTMTRVMEKGHVLFTARYVASIIGRVISMQSVIGPRARLRTREMYKCVLSKASWNAPVVLSNGALDEIQFWLLNIHRLNGAGCKLKENRVCTSVVCTDASGSGYGGYIRFGGGPLEGYEFDVGQDTYTMCGLKRLTPCAGIPLEGYDFIDIGQNTPCAGIPLEGRHFGAKVKDTDDLCEGHGVSSVGIPLEELKVSKSTVAGLHVSYDDVDGKCNTFLEKMSLGDQCTDRLSDSHIVTGTWNDDEKTCSSTWRELEGMKRVLFSSVDHVQGQHIKLVTDNKNVCSIVKVGSNKPDLQTIACELNVFCQANGVSISTQWVPRHMNKTADFLSRCMDSDDWSVQRWVFDLCEALWGPHEVDRFAADYNNMCCRFNSRVWCNGTETVDAFTVSWQGLNNWIVPPPRLICIIIEKMSQEKARGTLIVPAWMSAPFWPLLCPMGEQFARFVVDYRILLNKNITVKGRGNNGIFGRPVLPFDMLALRLDFLD